MTIEIAEDLADVTKTWVDQGRLVTFHAWQEPALIEGADPRVSIAEFEIQIDGTIAYTGTAPWLRLGGEPSLGLQIYVYSQMPHYTHSEYQGLMEGFAQRCAGFILPSRDFWKNANDEWWAAGRRSVA